MAKIKAWQDKTCPVCGEDFIAEYPSSRYCSEECKEVVRNAPQIAKDKKIEKLEGDLEMYLGMLDNRQEEIKSLKEAQEDLKFRYNELANEPDEQAKLIKNLKTDLDIARKSYERWGKLYTEEKNYTSALLHHIHDYENYFKVTKKHAEMIKMANELTLEIREPELNWEPPKEE